MANPREQLLLSRSLASMMDQVIVQVFHEGIGFLRIPPMVTVTRPGIQISSFGRAVPMSEIAWISFDACRPRETDRARLKRRGFRRLEYVITTPHGRVFGQAMDELFNVGLTMATVKSANDDEEFYRWRNSGSGPELPESDEEDDDELDD